MLRRTTNAAGRLPALDGIRGVACLMVFAVHFGQTTRLDGNLGPFELARALANGNTGVAIFFVLSGFLLSLPYWRQMHHGTAVPSLLGYWAHRCARILPAYYLCLTALVVLNRHWRESDGTLDIVSHYLLIFNYSDQWIFSINPPFWTLAVEFQFYALLPVLFAVRHRLRPSQLVCVLAILAVGAYFAHAAIASAAVAALPDTARGRLSPVIEYSLLAHMPLFILGMCAGHFYTARSGRRRIGPLGDTAAWIAVLAIGVSIATPLDDMLRIPFGRYNLPYLPIAIAVLMVFVTEARTMNAILSAFPLRGLGVISYGIYVFHLPIQNLTGRYLKAAGFPPQEDWWIFGIVSLALTIMVSTVSYVVIERQVVAWVRRHN